MAHNAALRNRIFAFGLIVVSTLAVIASASAAEPLRWKLTPSQKLNYEMALGISFGGTSIEQTLHLVWDVQQVDEQGNATFQLSFDEVQMKMEMPGMPGIEYDSTDPEPDETAAALAPQFEALMDNPVEVTMTPRGEISDVKVPEAMTEALKNSPGGGVGNLASKEGIKELLEQGTMTLPENAPADGEEWSTTVEKDLPVGKQKLETTYKYVGTRDVAGDTIAVVQPMVKVSIAGMGVKDQQTSGEILFNQSEGRLDSSTVNQDVTFEIPMGDQSMEQQVKQKIEIKVTEADETKSEAADAQ